MFSIITPGGSAAAANPAPHPGSPTPPNSPAESNMANKDNVGLAEALKGTDHTKITQFSVSDTSKGSGGPNSGGGPNWTGGPGSGGGPGNSVPLGGLVQGKVVVELMDSLIPALLVVVFHKLEVATKKTDFQLTVGEKNTLAPIVEACLNSINLNFDSPWTTLAISLAVIYGGKALEKGGVAFLDKKADESKPADPDRHNRPAKGFKPMTAAAPSPIPDATDTGAFVEVREPVLPSWTEADVKKVEARRKRGRAEAIDWLNKNWKKKGGVV